MSDSNNQTVNQAQKALLDRIRSATGKLKSAWREVSEIMLDSAGHFYAHSHNAGPIGYLYNKLIEADHRTMARTVEIAALELCGIKFRKDDNDANKKIAYKSDKEYARIQTDGYADKQRELLREKGLQAFKPKRADSAKGKGENGNVAGLVEVLDKGLAQIANDPRFASETAEARRLINEALAIVNKALSSGGYGVIQMQFRKAMESAEKVAEEQKATGTDG